MEPEIVKRQETGEKDYVNREQDNVAIRIKKPAAVKEADNKRERRYKDLDHVIEQYSREPGQLIRILHKAQDIFGYLPEDVQAYIAEKTETPVSEVNGVVTFYSLFSTEPKGKCTLKVCMGTACYVKGAQEIMDAIKEHLKVDEGETTADKLFTVKSTRCVGACGLAPVLVANDDVYGEAGAKDVVKIIHEYRKGEKIESSEH
ncbi:MAG: NADP-reducing hydrogenase subunit HndA [Pelotomaculum sp. PtaU1.Bin035]|nr:MAG: NADP-reducing hydrogenase subunit HndA [Pelotomaculum sp. PtaU1.Bin035]